MDSDARASHLEPSRSFPSPANPSPSPSPSPSPATRIGRGLIEFLRVARGLGAFSLIAFGVMVTKLGVARRVMMEMILEHLLRAGLRLLPMIAFLALALGLVVIGQSVSLLSRVGANEFLGTIMVTVVVREVGPLVTTLVVLARVGTAYVVELGTSRAMGEVEALEGMGIDPVHFLVVPRLVGMALGTFALTIYFIIGAILSGYLWAFIQDVPLQPDDYFRQLASSLTGLDFALLAAKTCLFGTVVAIVTCYHGLARRLPLQKLSRATVRAVAQSVVAIVLIDSLFIIVYLAAA